LLHLKKSLIFFLLISAFSCKYESQTQSPQREIFSHYGIDVSVYQGGIRWDAIPKKFEFAIIKATEGSSLVDRRFHENLEGSRSSGKIVGAYHYFRFSENGDAQASLYIKTVGRNIDFPPIIDVEFIGNAANADPGKVRKELTRMIAALETYYGVEPILYVTRKSFSEIIRGYFRNPLWFRSIAHIPEKVRANVVLWQYSDQGTVAGIDADVDLNLIKGYPREIRKILFR
jgi:lysozyme